MTRGISQTVCYDAIRARDKKYDGMFYFALKTSDTYCRPSCPDLPQVQEAYIFFDTTREAELFGYRPCKRCYPNRLKNILPQQILGNIDAGAINDKGVHGLADFLHVSERHLRRIVNDKTGSSPARLNRIKRLEVAKRLVTQTKSPIIEVAFSAGFSSLRQFNGAFKAAYKVSPREMRKAILPLAQNEITDLSSLLSKLFYIKILQM